MRILRIIASMDPVNGGPCQGIRNSIPALYKLGVFNEVLCFDSPVSDFLKKDDFINHAIGPAIGPYAYCGTLQKWLRENISRFDVIIIHGVWLYNSFGSFFFWKHYKKKHHKAPRIFLMPHGMLDPYFQKARGRKLKALRNILFWNLIEKKVINGMDGLFFTCAQELLLARETFRSYHPKAEINIGYGIQEPPEFDKMFKNEFLKSCPGVDSRPYWLFLSRIHQKKGVDLLLMSYSKLKRIKDDIPDLVIAGPGIETAYGKSLRTMGCGNSVHFPGMLEGDQKWGAFYGCETFILPSHQENFGIAVVEAMACRKPVLISNKVNIWREIEQGKGGLVYEDKVESLYTTLEKFLNLSPENKDALGKNALQLFNKQFTVEQASKKMMASLQEE